MLQVSGTSKGFVMEHPVPNFLSLKDPWWELK